MLENFKYNVKNAFKSLHINSKKKHNSTYTVFCLIYNSTDYRACVYVCLKIYIYVRIHIYECIEKLFLSELL